MAGRVILGAGSGKGLIVAGLSIEFAGDDCVTIGHESVALARYVYRPKVPQRDSPRPFAHLRTLDGHLITALGPVDHPWHAGLSWALPHVGDANFWGGPTYERGQGYVQRANNGTVRHRSFSGERPGDGSDRSPIEAPLRSVAQPPIQLTESLDWIAQDGRLQCTEARGLIFELQPQAGAWSLVFTTTMRNETDDVLAFGSPSTAGRENAGYGGLFWRGPDSFRGGAVHTARGVGGDSSRGCVADWMGYSGRHGEAPDSGSSTIVMVDDPQNPRHPPQWFVRSDEYAGLCPAPFFSEELLLAPGGLASFRYAVIIADGDARSPRAAELAAVGRNALVAAARTEPADRERPAAPNA